MIEQTIPLDALTRGMASCLREWILPHLEDPLARVQAEQLAALLEALPRVTAAGALELIRSDTEEGRALLTALGEAGPPPAEGETVEARMRENGEVKARLSALADRYRRGEEPGDRERLVELQRFFLRSLARELRGASAEGTDFASLTSKESAARRK